MAHKFTAFLKIVFNATAENEHCNNDNVIMNAEYRVGDSLIMFANTRPDVSARVNTLYIYVKNTDAVYESALANGAESLMPLADPFYGDRSAGIVDAWGNQWWLATHIEDVSAEELGKRMASLTSQSQPKITAKI